MPKAEIPKSEFMNEITVGNVTIPCAVLDTKDGPIRLLTQEGFLESLGRAGKAKGGHGASVDKLPPFLAANNLKPFMPTGLEESTRPIIFRTPKGNKAFGYRAELLPKVCEIYIDADEAGQILPSQKRIVRQAHMLIRGLAHVGIAALIDEATGYQEVRDRLALQKILEKYLTDEWAKWTKTFPDTFYKELFRLKKIPYPPDPSGKKPQYVGHWTNDIVYDRLAPGIRKRLQELNPRGPRGNRLRKNFQYFTDDYGTPELRQHLHAVEALMRACTSWDDFKRRLERAFSKYGDTMPLDGV
jgi:hypothetical protein